MNKARIIGRVYKGGINFNDDLNGGDPMCRFQLAVTERWKDNEHTELVNIFVHGKDAEKMRTARDGNLVYVKGLARTGKYQKDGDDIYYMDIESRQLKLIKESRQLAQDDQLDQNEVTLIGRLGHDPKVFKNGKATSFSMACDEYNGKQAATQWLTVTTFDKSAKSAADFLTKGRLVAVEGRLRTSEYEAKDGEIKSTTSIVAHKWTPLDAKPRGANLKSTDSTPQSKGEFPPF